MSDLRTALRTLSQEVSGRLPDISALTDRQLAYVLLTYQGLVEPNFIPFLVNVMLRCRSEVARSACKDNLLCEVREDHPRMLRDFVQPACAHVTPNEIRNCMSAAHAYETAETLNRITRWPGNASRGLVVLAALEGTSLVFMPWLEAAAQRLGATDLTYTQKHGAADIGHADQFVAAVEAELQIHPNPGEELEVVLHHPIRFTREFLIQIFGAYQHAA